MNGVRLSPEERAAIRRRFVILLCNFQCMEMWWCPIRSRLILRSPAAQKKQRLPSTARKIGLYTHPFGADAFLGDLDDVLAKIEAEELKRGRGDAQHFALA